MTFAVAMRRSILVLLAVFAVSSCATAPEPAPEIQAVRPPTIAPPPDPFAPEPTARLTFTGGRRFETGTRLRFVSFTLSSLEQLRLERCGEPCSTAKLVGSWNKADFDRSPAQELVLKESGDYYLWLRKELANGEIGPVQAASGTFDRENGVLRFVSGTVVFVAIDGAGAPVDWPDDSARVATEIVHDENSELRKLESASILEKARHGVKQDLFVQIEPGESVNALFRETLPRQAETAGAAQADARRAAAWSRYQAALRDLKLRMLEPLKASGVEMTQDFDLGPSLVVSVSSEAGLRALQAAPLVTVISEIHRVVPT